MDIGDYLKVGYRNQNSIFLSVKKLIQKNKIESILDKNINMYEKSGQIKKHGA